MMSLGVDLVNFSNFDPQYCMVMVPTPTYTACRRASRRSKLGLIMVNYFTITALNLKSVSPLLWALPLSYPVLKGRCFLRFVKPLLREVYQRSTRLWITHSLAVGRCSISRTYPFLHPSHGTAMPPPLRTVNLNAAYGRRQPGETSSAAPSSRFSTQRSPSCFFVLLLHCT